MTVEQAPPPPGLIYILGWWREVSTAPLMSAVVLTARPRAQTRVPYIADDAGNVMYGVGVSAATDPEGRALLTLVWVEGAVYDVEFGGVKGTLRCDDWAEGSTVPFTGIRGIPGGDGIADPLTWDAVISGLNGRIADQVPPAVRTELPTALSEQLAIPGSPTSTAVTNAAAATANATVGAVVRGQTGRKYVALGAVIRNDGAGFYALDDAGHRASWIDSIETTATYIRVNYAAAAATKAVTFIAANDEKFAREGLFLGTSVNLASTDIFIYRQAQPIADYVYYDGTNWATSKGRFTFGPTAFNPATGVLTLDHAPITSSESVAASATARGARFGVTVEACTTTTTQIVFRTASATGPNYFPAALTPDVNMKAYVQVGGGFQVSVNPQDLTTTTYPGSNLWLIGLMEVA